jgi:hypothetical protein
VRAAWAAPQISAVFLQNSPHPNPLPEGEGTRIGNFKTRSEHNKDATRTLFSHETHDLSRKRQEKTRRSTDRPRFGGRRCRRTTRGGTFPFRPLAPSSKGPPGNEDRRGVNREERGANRRGWRRARKANRPSLLSLRSSPSRVPPPAHRPESSASARTLCSVWWAAAHLSFRRRSTLGSSSTASLRDG